MLLARRRLPLTLSSSSSSVSYCCSLRCLGTNGRVTNEDRRWWLLHLECTPDVTPGTFAAWLDACGTHTTKKLIERNIWSIEQVAALEADEVDELKYRDGCVKMDVVWEHARTILPSLQSRSAEGGVQSDLHGQVSKLRMKRELEKQRKSILHQQEKVHQQREATIQAQREALIARKKELQQRLSSRQSAAAAANATEGEAANPPPAAATKE